ERGRLLHSGYNRSLRQGRMVDDSTAHPLSHPRSADQYDEVMDNAPPPTELSFPTYFSQDNDRLSYDPLRESLILPASQLSSVGFALADNWPSGSDSGNDSGDHSKYGDPLHLA